MHVNAQADGSASATSIELNPVRAHVRGRIPSIRGRKVVGEEPVRVGKKLTRRQNEERTIRSIGDYIRCPLAKLERDSTSRSPEKCYKPMRDMCRGVHNMGGSKASGYTEQLKNVWGHPHLRGLRPASGRTMSLFREMGPDFD